MKEFHDIIDLLEDEWQRRYKKLETEKELYRINFILTKKCNCKSNECKHYEAGKKKLFGRRINKLLLKGIMINAIADARAMASEPKP